MELKDRLFAVLKQRFPEADDDALWHTVVMLLVAFADDQGISLA